MDISINTLYLILVLAHLAASGGQVWSSDVLSDGTSSTVLAFLIIFGAAIISSTVAAIVSWYDFVDGHRRAIAKGHRWGIIALGLVSAVKSIAFLEAFKYVSVLNAAVYIPLIPVFAMMIARFVGWESFGSWQQIFGAFLAITGALLVTIVSYKGEASAEGALDTLLGNLLLLTWVLGAAVGIVCQRPLLKHHSPLCLTAYVCCIAAVAIAVVAPFKAHKLSDWQLSGVGWASAVYSANFNLVHGWSDSTGVTMIPASTVAMFLVLEPVFTDFLSWATGGGSMDMWEYIGAGLTCAGLVVVLSAVEPTATTRPGVVGNTVDNDAELSIEKPVLSDNTPLLGTGPA